MDLGCEELRVNGNVLHLLKTGVITLGNSSKFSSNLNLYPGIKIKIKNQNQER